VEGTSLGLGKKIAELYGISLSATDILGSGTTFTTALFSEGMMAMSHDHHGRRDGREHHFDPETFLAREDELRRVLSPESVLEDLLPSPDLTFVDVGCGPGFFALPAARLLFRGTVQAFDHQDDMVSLLERRARSEGLHNIHAVRSDAATLPLEDGSADAALMANVLHDLEHREASLAEVHRILKPGGAFCVVEWGDTHLEVGPPPFLRLRPEDLAGLLIRSGFAIRKISHGPAPFFRILCRRP